jgi:hypothetical protein
MSYLFPLGSTTELGQLRVGANINVDVNSTISIPQSIETTANVVFHTVDAANAITLNGTPVVYKLLAGENIGLSAASGIVTISATGEGIVKTVGAAVTYTATATDEYIGATINPTQITLPPGVTGKMYTIKNESNSGTTTVRGSTGESLDGSTTKSLSGYASLTVVFRNGKWNIV